MKILSFLLGAIVSSASIGSKALSHPHHHGTSPVPVVAPVSLIPLQAEEIMGFEYSGQYYTVVNTHQRGLFIGELIQIRDSHGALAHQWWSIHGWCFTAHAYENQACWSQSHYLNIFASYLNRASFTPPTGGGLDTEDEYVFCEHYTKLEYKISGDTSDVCDYGS